MVNPVQIIEKKRDGQILSSEEIEYFVRGAVNNEVPDYQISALLMATFLNGMNPNETAALTRAMTESGKVLNLSDVPGPLVDKHSTGGIGDKVSIILAPLAATCGLSVPMMAGRGLGHSGGTLDKLESISGFNVNLTEAERITLLKKIGCLIVGQTKDIAPADRMFYSLRDVTGTVASIPLIVASILSKKKAEGTKHLVMDIKVGNGAFMEKKSQAKALGRQLISVGKKLDIKVSAVLTDMNQPLGYAAGNSLEIIECIDVFKNQRSSFPGTTSIDLKELTLRLCAEMLTLSAKARNFTEARKIARANLESGEAWIKFKEMVKLQGGDVSQIENPELLPLSKSQKALISKKTGYLSSIDTKEIGLMIVDLGGGRHQVTDSIDHGVGFVFHKKLGAKVSEGDKIATLFYENGKGLKSIEERFYSAIAISRSRKKTPPLILEILN